MNLVTRELMRVLWTDRCLILVLQLEDAGFDPMAARDVQ